MGCDAVLFGSCDTSVSEECAVSNVRVNGGHRFLQSIGTHVPNNTAPLVRSV